MPILILLNRSVFLIGYIVYVAPLLRMANDVEEKPGPTVYDIVEPSQTICANFSQGNRRQFGQSAGNQCVAMSLTAIIHTQVKDITTWDSIFLNTILSAGNKLYTCISKSIKKELLLLTDVPELISVHNNVYYWQYSDSLADVFMITDNEDFIHWQVLLIKYSPMLN